jgi:hypothetical protein
MAAQNKLKKEEIQKIVLGALLALGVVYGFFDILYFPLKKREKAKRVSIDALEPEIAASQAKIARIGEIEKAEPEARKIIDRIEAMMPEGSPVAWFPTLINDFFKGQRIEKVTTRLASEAPDKDIPSYKRVVWSIELPKTECVSFASSLAEFENEAMLVEIQGIVVETQPEEPAFQRVTLAVNNIVKQ